jgi:hypothetical protein
MYCPLDSTASDEVEVVKLPPFKSSMHSKTLRKAALRSTDPLGISNVLSTPSVNQFYK